MVVRFRACEAYLIFQLLSDGALQAQRSSVLVLTRHDDDRSVHLVVSVQVISTLAILRGIVGFGEFEQCLQKRRV